MNLYSIYQCKISKIDQVVSFLDINWKKNHSLVLSRELLNFQHYNIKERKYNFILAENNVTHEIDALIGFIPTSQYDLSLECNGDYWGAIWKRREDVSNNEIKIVGIYTWMELFTLPNFKSYAAIGISDIAKEIYQAAGLKLGTLNHYYMLNAQKDNFNIAKNIKPDSTVHSESNMDYRINYISLDDVSVSPKNSYRPAKSIIFFNKRYAHHPIYKYKFLGIFFKNKLISIWAVRLITIMNSNILRIIDVLGDIDEFPNLQDQIQKILIADNAEYIDILNYGIAENIFSTIGFLLLSFDDETIIPSYFEPFESKNVKIDFAYKADFNYTIFKGDGDQDRPSIL